MPAYHRFRLDDEQGILPRAKEISHNAEEHPIETPYSEFGRGSQRDFELLSEKQVLELKLCSRFEVFEEKREERTDHLNLLTVNEPRSKAQI